MEERLPPEKGSLFFMGKPEVLFRKAGNLFKKGESLFRKAEKSV